MRVAWKARLAPQTMVSLDHYLDIKRDHNNLFMPSGISHSYISVLMAVGGIFHFY